MFVLNGIVAASRAGVSGEERVYTVAGTSGMLILGGGQWILDI